MACIFYRHIFLMIHWTTCDSLVDSAQSASLFMHGNFQEKAGILSFFGQNLEFNIFLPFQVVFGSFWQDFMSFSFIVLLTPASKWLMMQNMPYEIQNILYAWRRISSLSRNMEISFILYRELTIQSIEIDRKVRVEIKSPSANCPKNLIRATKCWENVDSFLPIPDV